VDISAGTQHHDLVSLTSPYLSIMVLRSPSAIMLWLPLVVLYSVWCAHAKKDSEPRIATKTFDSQPSNLLWFDDTEVLLVQEREHSRIWRSDDGGESWKQMRDFDEDAVGELWLHPYDNKKAYALGKGSRQWVTNNRGETWDSFDLDENVGPAMFREPFSFHAGDSDKVILNAQTCKGDWNCEESSYYTTDNFDSLHLLRDNTRGCHFARSTPLFKTSADDKDDDRILCVAVGKYSFYPKDNRLLVSDNFFSTETEPLLGEDRTVSGIINMAIVKGYLVVAAKAEDTTELALYVTDDAKIWHRAMFPHKNKLEEDAYTILESTNYSIQVDVLTSKATHRMGSLFSSNSNGTYFTELIKHTNRNYLGIVDFEKVQNIQGIVMVNIVDNYEEVLNKLMVQKKVVTQISFDDGRTWHSPKVKGKDLHLHSVTEMSNSGRVFSSSAPGLIMGIGNTGEYLKSYNEGDLYVSDDAGLTWALALEGAHKYEFGDKGSLLVAVLDEGLADAVYYSIDHGQKWNKAKLPDAVNAKLLTTTPDSTSLKFILSGTTGGGSKTEYIIYSIDFSGLHERTCQDDDFEKWFARLDDKGEPSCLMGHEQKFRRRKKNADCFINEEFKDPLPIAVPCKCSKIDFECDYNFIRSDDKEECIPATTLPRPEGACKGKETKYMGSSGWRLIPGNDCIREEGVNLDKEVERDCSDTVKVPVSGKISHTINKFDADGFKEYYYLERTTTSTGEDETILMRTDTETVYISDDHGKSWKPIPELEYENVVAIVPHQYFNDIVYFLTDTEKVFYTINRAQTVDYFNAPRPPTMDSLASISFHPVKADFIIWTGEANCGVFSEGECHNIASFSSDRGDSWKTLLRYVKKCEFIKSKKEGSEKLIYCEQFKDEDLKNPLQLLSSDNLFEDSEVHFDDILTFATMAEFIIVAQRDPEQNLKVDASADGMTFAAAEFPKNFNVPHQRAYTLLDSSTHAVFLHVTVGDREGFEYGKLMKSNSNGTSYVLSIDGVNRNGPGYVDFEKMQGLEGVAIINVVGNLKEEEARKPKKLKTMITHSDGALWDYIPAPKTDNEDKDYGCSVDDVKTCSLHLHGYTERRDPRATFSSASAVGLMMGVGNVGEYLTRKAEADTFITRDGGISWHNVMKGNYMWEYGDQGSIIVIVEDNVATDHVYYSLNEGAYWEKYIFSDKPMIISAITTVPSDNSRNFLLWQRGSGSGGKVAAINIDFSGLRGRKCELNEEDPMSEEGDYTLWSPSHPQLETNCLFGHVSQYHRKKPESDCWNMDMIHQLHNVFEEDCACTRKDFEW
jgi:photosystem II stability/assembly factor-like uncharacterized protein